MKNPLVISLFLPVALLNGVELPDTIDFNEHIQPILSENCYHCHGPDSSTRAPKSEPLRLDREEFAFMEREDAPPPIIKGDPDASEVIKRIISTDPDEVMPTPDSHKKPLKTHEVALLKKWIKQGAVYEEHWSFISPTRPDVPKQTWGENAVDAFISNNHQQFGLDPNKPEDAARLIRRLTFDITGLPPTPAEVASFRESAAQDLPTAVKMAVGRLLATDEYAEHFGRHWLDAARYADSHGIHIDNYPPSGLTVIGSSMPSAKTCPSINSRSSKSRATFFPIPPSNKRSPPASTAASPPREKAVPSTRNTR